MTGFVVRNVGSNGCFLGYISQTDPKGKLPIWLVNTITQKFAPKVVKQLKKAAEGYDRWKEQQMYPNLKPWVYPELTLKAPRISINEVCLNLLKSTWIAEFNAFVQFFFFFGIVEVPASYQFDKRILEKQQKL